MEHITARQLNIIKLLSISEGAVSSIELSQAIGCSTKTIQVEIKDINKILKSRKIISVREVGYKIEGSLEEVNLSYNICNDIDRVIYIIKELLNLNILNKDAIKLEYLANSMYASVSTVKNDLNYIMKI
ncbi:MAG: HTH domain-containing protein [Romboutsia sp.]|uniref:HTH domain-containing protein n=1 Tax=Romboutsia sp. TaxID=1965302 RepID=UPI003F2F5A5E